MAVEQIAAEQYEEESVDVEQMAIDIALLDIIKEVLFLDIDDLLASATMIEPLQHQRSVDY